MPTLGPPPNVAALGCGCAQDLAAAASLKNEPTPTATPRPRLSSPRVLIPPRPRARSHSYSDALLAFIHGTPRSAPRSPRSALAPTLTLTRSSLPSTTVPSYQDPEMEAIKAKRMAEMGGQAGPFTLRY